MHTCGHFGATRGRPIFHEVSSAAVKGAGMKGRFFFFVYAAIEIFSMNKGDHNAQLNSTQLNEHVRTQVLTPQCPHLFNTTTYEGVTWCVRSLSAL